MQYRVLIWHKNNEQGIYFPTTEEEALDRSVQLRLSRWLEPEVEKEEEEKPEEDGVWVW